MIKYLSIFLTCLTVSQTAFCFKSSKETLGASVLDSDIPGNHALRTLQIIVYVDPTQDICSRAQNWLSQQPNIADIDDSSQHNIFPRTEFHYLSPEELTKSCEEVFNQLYVTRLAGTSKRPR